MDHTSIEKREKERGQGLEIEAIREERRKREYKLKNNLFFTFAGDYFI